MIGLERDGPVATIRLDRPEKHNALELDGIAALGETLDEALAGGAGAVVLTGAGERSFCSGVSLGDVGGAAWEENPLTALCDRLEKAPVPTVAALNGGVYGGAVEIALSCDFRMGVEGMRMFAPPARLGIHYEAAGLRRAAATLGLQTARRIYLGADEFAGPELLETGFVDSLHPREEFADAVRARAEALATLAPLAYAGMKETLRQIAHGTLDEAAARERVAACWASNDLAEGLAAMREKRPPKFRGR